MSYALGEDAGGPFIHCLECQTRSHNPNDIREHYCGYCHIFHGDGRIIYDADRTLPLKLYVFRPDGFHEGCKWFRNILRYPDEEITTMSALVTTGVAMEKGLEVRICNGGDFCVFHSKDGEVVYPPEGFDAFWNSVLKPR
jgi:hypothetical protein